MRMTVIVLCLGLVGCGLAGCAGTGGGGEPSLAALEPSPTPIPSPVASEPAPQSQSRSRHVAAARPAPAPARQPEADDGPMTHEKASTICWMRYEDAKLKLSLDKRADLVNQCVDDTLRGGPTR